MNVFAHTYRLSLAVALVHVGLFSSTGANDAVDDFARRSSWTPPPIETVQQQVTSWSESLDLNSTQSQEFEQVWSDVEKADPAEILDRVVQSLAIGNEGVKELLVELQKRKPSSAIQLPDATILAEEALPAWARNNLRLHYGQWLADRQYYNEVRDQLESLKPADVVNPAALLFYQSVAYHRLLEKDKCLPTLELLLESEDSIPRRYATTARLMQSDIEPLKADSLDEVSRLMDSIRVRLGHGRAGRASVKRKTTSSPSWTR